MNKEFANQFSLDWIEAWNSHDLDKILSHYEENIQMSSPVITQIMNVESGVLKGKETVRAYWQTALELNPELHFDLIKAFTGANSVIIHYQGHRGLAAEMFIFNEKGKVKYAYAHYE